MTHLMDEEHGDQADGEPWAEPERIRERGQGHRRERDGGLGDLRQLEQLGGLAKNEEDDEENLSPACLLWHFCLL